MSRSQVLLQEIRQEISQAKQKSGLSSSTIRKSLAVKVCPNLVKQHPH